MAIRIHDLNNSTTYIANSEEECHGSDVHAFQMANMLWDTVTMGKVIAEPIKQHGREMGHDSLRTIQPRSV